MLRYDTAEVENGLYVPFNSLSRVTRLHIISAIGRVYTVPDSHSHGQS